MLSHQGESPMPSDLTTDPIGMRKRPCFSSLKKEEDFMQIRFDPTWQEKTGRDFGQRDVLSEGENYPLTPRSWNDVYCTKKTIRHTPEGPSRKKSKKGSTTRRKAATNDAQQWESSAVNRGAV